MYFSYFNFIVHFLLKNRNLKRNAVGFETSFKGQSTDFESVKINSFLVIN